MVEANNLDWTKVIQSDLLTNEQTKMNLPNSFVRYIRSLAPSRARSLVQNCQIVSFVRIFRQAFLVGPKSSVLLYILFYIFVHIHHLYRVIA